ncbi:MAG: hypothetical protein V1728_02150 [Candidatus Micrarchaeota archaeon]
MRPVYLSLFVLAFLCASASAFDASAYLYDTENSATITSETLSGGNGAFTLYKIDGTPALLTSGDTLLTDQAQIEAALSLNYQNTVLPTSDESASIRADLLSFNDSRNIKTRLAPYGIEYMCLQSTGLISIPCDTSSACYGTANVVCGLYAAGGGGSGCYPEILAPLILDYSLDVSTLNDNIAPAFSSLSSLTPDNAQDALSTIQTRISALKAAAASLSSNELRFPEGSAATCPNCIGLCASPQFDTASLDDANSKISTILTRMSSSGSPAATALQVAKSTSDRVAYQKNAQIYAIWAPKWNAFKANYSSLRDQALDLSNYVSDPNFTSAALTFSETWPKVESEVASRNFAGIETDFSSLQAAVPALQASIKQGAKPYATARSAQNNASDALIRARWETNAQDKPSVDSYNSLASRKKALDALFAPPMTSAQYANLSAKYAALQNDVEAHIAAQRGAAGSAYNVGGQFGQTAINGVFSLTDALLVLPASTRTQVAPVIPPFVLFLTDLALVAVALIVFIGVLLYFKPVFRNRGALGVWVVALFAFLFFLGIASVSMFLLINQSAHQGTLSDYLALVGNSGGASYVAIDQTGSSADTVAAMASCAGNISSQLKARFKNASTIVFSYSGNACAWGSATNYTYPQCIDKTGGKPIIFLHYVKTAQPPEFSVVYQKQADAYGDAAYYQRCEIGDVIN